MDKENFKELLNGYIEGAINEVELKNFITTLHEPEKELLWEEAIEEALLTKNYSGLSDPAKANLLFQNIMQAINVSKEKGGKVRHISLLRVAAAVTIILALSIGGYLLFFNKTSHQQPTTSSQQLARDIAPAKNGAILTIGNGKQIVLDTATDGRITDAAVKNGNEVSYVKSETSNVKMEYNNMSTPRGRQFQLVLADGSKVWLNAASSITYPTSFTGSDRTVSITGEVYFEVAHDATKPFHVKTESQDIEVLGTHFNVNSYSDEDIITTTLLEGSVKVILPFDRLRAGSAQGNKEAVIKPGEQTQIDKTNSSLIRVIRDADLDKVMAWRNGWFEFDQTTLPVIMRQISRWYDVDIVYEGKVTDEKFGGRISRNLNLSNILSTLEKYGVRFKLEGKTLTVEK